jgi:hypothetical protein
MTIVGTQLNVMFVRVLGEVKGFRMKDRNLGCAERRNEFHLTARTNIPRNDLEAKRILLKRKRVGGTKRLSIRRDG